MNNNIIEIDIPEGYEIDKNKSTFDKIVFKKVEKNIRDRIQGIDDILYLNALSYKDFNNKCKYLSTQEINMLLEGYIANAYNDGIKVNNNDNKQRKYYPCFNNSPSFKLVYIGDYTSLLNVPSRFIFVGKDAPLNIKDAISKFLDVYKKSRL